MWSKHSALHSELFIWDEISPDWHDCKVFHLDFQLGPGVLFALLWKKNISSQVLAACWRGEVGCSAGVYNLTLLHSPFWCWQRLLWSWETVLESRCFFYYVSVLRKTNKARCTDRQAWGVVDSWNFQNSIHFLYPKTVSWHYFTPHEPYQPHQ